MAVNLVIFKLLVAKMNPFFSLQLPVKNYYCQFPGTYDDPLISVKTKINAQF